MQSYEGGSVMVWGGVSSTARTDLHIFLRGTLNSRIYVTDILEQYVVRFALFIRNNFVFQYDNARPHGARMVSEYLNEVGISAMQWPAKSPDLNTIEHVCDIIGRRVRALQPPPATLVKLNKQLIAIWDNQNQEYILSTIDSMGRRCEAVIYARGGNARY